ncbi:hypothetical protein DFP73DRAFT_562542 [Morchella snyderi]|nr:hypothetical protein DFP73DRAFT_562542 [Morchella snyderi]
MVLGEVGGQVVGAVLCGGLGGLVLSVLLVVEGGAGVVVVVVLAVLPGVQVVVVVIVRVGVLVAVAAVVGGRAGLVETVVVGVGDACSACRQATVEARWVLTLLVALSSAWRLSIVDWRAAMSVEWDEPEAVVDWEGLNSGGLTGALEGGV